MRCARTRHAPHQIKTLSEIRATFVLVFHFWYYAQRLAKVFLMLPMPLSFCADHPVVALDQQKLTTEYGSYL